MSKLLLLALVLLTFSSADAGLLGKGCAPPVNSGVPAQASAVGFNTLTSNSTYISPTGGNWYFYNFEGSPVYPANATQNSNGTISLQGNTEGAATLSTAQKPTPQTANGFVGVGYGGGMYWEVVATISTPLATPGVPAALWLVDLEHTSQGSIYINNWPNTLSTFWPSVPQLQNQDASSSYDDYLEIDMMEYDFTTAEGHPAGYEINMSNWNNHLTDSCGSGALNWGQSNQWHQTAGGSSGSTPVPVGTNFTQQHTYSILWVPAQGSGQTTTSQGYVRVYFDGVQIAGGLPSDPPNPYDGYPRPMYWNYHDPTDYTHYPTPTAAGAPTHHNQGYCGGTSYPTYGDVDMSIMDWRHMMPIMNSGSNQSMTIYSSKIWQASAAKNIQF